MFILIKRTTKRAIESEREMGVCERDPSVKQTANTIELTGGDAV